METALALPPLNSKYISYSDEGQGEVLVLIHPFLTDKTFWSAQQQELRSYFRLITIDLWGFGHSEPISGSASTMNDYSDEILQLLDQLYIKKAIIGGESTGGYVALNFLTKHPNRVKGLLLSNTQATAVNLELKKKLEQTATLVLNFGSEFLVDFFVNAALSTEASAQTRQTLLNIARTQRPQAIADALIALSGREDSTLSLSKSKLPILIITSDKDRLIAPQESANMQALAENSKLVLIANAGHLSSLEQSKQWSKAVREMFQPALRALQTAIATQVHKEE